MNRIKIQNICNHSFLSSLVTSQDTVLDCGSNHGQFAKWCGENLKVKVFGFEPDPRLFSRLPNVPNVSYAKKAVGEKVGKIELFLGETKCSSAYYNCAKEAGSELVDMIDLDTFCKAEEITSVGLLKLDIEGGELPVLENLPEKFLKDNIKQITVEFHEFLNKDDVPRIKYIVRRLKKLGFIMLKASLHTYGDVLFINNKLARLSVSDRIWLIITGKYWAGFKRILYRIFKK